MAIRKSNLKDVTKIIRLDNEFAEYSKLYDESITDKYIEESQLELINRTSNKFINKILYVYEEDSELFGYITGRNIMDSKCILDCLFVKSEERGKGLGEALLNEFIVWAKSKNIKKVYVEYYPSDLKAKNFYFKNGFRESNGVVNKNQTRLEYDIK